MKHHLRIRKDGMLEWLAPPPHDIRMNLTSKELKRRFSEIVPDYHWPWHRFWFRVLRFLFGEHGQVATWTRSWECVWRAEILLGPHKGDIEWSWDREYLLSWERERWFSPKCKL